MFSFNFFARVEHILFRLAQMDFAMSATAEHRIEVVVPPTVESHSFKDLIRLFVEVINKSFVRCMSICSLGKFMMI